MTYEEQRQAYIDYLHVCIARADWHGVSDAANDLRVLEAEYGYSQKVVSPTNSEIPVQT